MSITHLQAQKNPFVFVYDAKGNVTRVVIPAPIQIGLPGNAGLTFIGGQATMGTYAARPAPGQLGSTYFSSDVPYISKDNGTSWINFGPIFALSRPPKASLWTTTNLSTNSVFVDQGDHLLLSGSSAGATPDIKVAVITAPATPYTVTALFGYTPQFSTGNTGEATAGLLFRNSSVGTLHVVGVQWASVSAGIFAPMLVSGKFSSPTAFTANYTLIQGVPCGGTFWLQISDDGTNRIARYSGDGVNFVFWHSIARADFLTADQVGFCIEPKTVGVAAALLSWKVTSP